MQLFGFAAGCFASGCIKESTHCLPMFFFIGHVHSKRRSIFALASGNFHIPTFHIAYGRFKLGHYALGRFGGRCFTLG